MTLPEEPDEFDLILKVSPSRGLDEEIGGSHT